MSKQGNPGVIAEHSELHEKKSLVKTILTPGIHWLYIFIPVTFALEYSHGSAPTIFFCAALSIIPIARLISTSTEHLATYTGDAVGGLLNATFGNLPELIIAIVALKAGLYDMVLASLAGAILANLLLALGFSFFLGGLKYHNQEYNPASIRLYSSMMMVAVISLTVPSAFHRLSVDTPNPNENALNISLSIALLIGYILYLVFMLRTHPDFFRSESGNEKEEEHESRWSLSRSIISLVAASVAAAFMSEILVGAAEETGKVLGLSSAFIGLIFLAVIGGAAESISAILMGRKNKMDLSIGIALGSSIQIALFVAPVLVLLSLFVGPSQMNLTFTRGIMVALFAAVIIGSMVAGDGRSNWYKGIQLLLVYLIIAMLLYFASSD
jgi:Ca2+:H+ antiporter